MAFIYKITNKLNNKLYIGKTEKTVDERFKEHCAEAFRDRAEKRPLYSAMRKYGISNFTYDIIEETDMPEEREMYWIAHYNTLKNGYNATLGGDGKKLYDYLEVKRLIEEKKTYSEIESAVGCSQDTIAFIAKLYNLQVLHQNAKIVKGINKQTQEKHCFNSAYDAARWLVEQGYTYSDPRDINSKIGQVCKGIRKSAYGFIWSYQ